MEWINKSGLVKILPDLLKTKVMWGKRRKFVWLEAKTLALKISQDIYQEDLDKTENMEGLNLVNFYILPHLNSQHFTKVRKDFIGEVVKGISEKKFTRLTTIRLKSR